MNTVENVCDYVISSVIEAGESLNNLKLQKLLYYVQAWHLVFENSPLIDEKFEAWVHGPVSREVFSRFASEKSLYSDVLIGDVRPDFTPASLTDSQREHIDRVLSVYAKFSGSQLEEMTHREDPWVKARNGCEPWERCSVPIDENLMKEYYSLRLKA